MIGWTWAVAVDWILGRSDYSSRTKASCDRVDVRADHTCNRLILSSTNLRYTPELVSHCQTVPLDGTQLAREEDCRCEGGESAAEAKDHASRWNRGAQAVMVI